MVAYNFQKQFANDVEKGIKTQTIRAPRKDNRHAKPGDTIQLYTGMRTKSCRKLGEGICDHAQNISISENSFMIINAEEGAIIPFFGEETLNNIALHDGFENYNEMLKWFEHTHGLPFEGVLISWELQSPDVPQQSKGSDDG